MNAGTGKYPITQWIGLGMVLLLCGHTSAQSLCEEIGHDSSFVRVALAERKGSPFAHYGYKEHPNAIWYSVEMNGVDILEPFFHTIPDRKKHVQWVPSSAMFPTDPRLDGSFILERGQYREIYFFTSGLITKILWMDKESVQIIDLTIINKCNIPVMMYSSQIKNNELLEKPIYQLALRSLIINCEGVPILQPSTYANYIIKQLCRK